jgi:hypothetical protein
MSKKSNKFTLGNVAGFWRSGRLRFSRLQRRICLPPS